MIDCAHLAQVTLRADNLDTKDDEQDDDSDPDAPALLFTGCVRRNLGLLLVIEFLHFFVFIDNALYG